MNPYANPRTFVVRVQSVEDPAPNAAPWYVCTAQEVVESDVEPVRVVGRQGMSGEDGREPYQAVTEAMASVLPEPDEDGPAPELAPAELWLVCQVNFAHAEYLPNDAQIRMDLVFDWNAPEHEEVWLTNDEEAMLAAARAAGVRDCDVEEANANFATVYRLLGTRETHENALRDFLDSLKSLSHGSDDDFYDYWPSGVRAAQAWANVLGGPWPQMVEDRIREILDDEELTRLREYEGKV